MYRTLPLDQIVQGFHRLFGRHLGVVSCDLEETEVGGFRLCERRVDRAEDGRTREPALVRIRSLLLEMPCEVRADADVIGDEHIAL